MSGLSNKLSIQLIDFVSNICQCGRGFVECHFDLILYKPLLCKYLFC